MNRRSFIFGSVAAAAVWSAAKTQPQKGEWKSTNYKVVAAYKMKIDEKVVTFERVH